MTEKTTEQLLKEVADLRGQLDREYEGGRRREAGQRRLSRFIVALGNEFPRKAIVAAARAVVTDEVAVDWRTHDLGGLHLNGAERDVYEYLIGGYLDEAKKKLAKKIEGGVRLTGVIDADD